MEIEDLDDYKVTPNLLLKVAERIKDIMEYYENEVKNNPNAKLTMRDLAHEFEGFIEEVTEDNAPAPSEDEEDDGGIFG